MAYGTTLDSLNEGILREGMAKGQLEDSFRNYLLGLAGERNRGRQVDVNAMDAGTRREGLGVTERLGNRQWDTEGRRVDVLGRDVDMRGQLGKTQYDVALEGIRAGERINERNAGVTGKYYDAIANPRPHEGLVVDVLTHNRSEQEAFDRVPMLVDALNTAITDTGPFWFDDKTKAAPILQEPWAMASMKHIRFNAETGKYESIPGSKPNIETLTPPPAPRTTPTPSPQPSPAPASQPRSSAYSPWGNAVYGPGYGSPRSGIPVVDPYMMPNPAPQTGPVSDVLTPPAQNPPASRQIQPGVVAYGGFGLSPRRSDPSTNAPPGRQVRRLVILPDGTTALE